MGCGSSSASVNQKTQNYNHVGKSADDNSPSVAELAHIVPNTKSYNDEVCYRTDLENIRDEMILALLVCRNCENPDHELSEWCMQCYEDDEEDGDGVPLPLLCIHCTKGLHRSKATKKHIREKYEAHTTSLSTPESYGYERFPPGLPYLDQLLCNNCDVINPTRWCGECCQITCESCATALHLPGKMKSHEIMTMNQKFVVAPVKHEKNIEALEMLVAASQLEMSPAPIQRQANNSYHTRHNSNDNNDTKQVDQKLGDMLKTYKNSIMLGSTHNRDTLLKALQVTEGEPGDLFVVDEVLYDDALMLQQLMFQEISATYNLGNLQVVQLSCGSDHAGAVTTLGSLFMWGSNHSAQLGRRTGESSIVLQPISVRFPKKDILVKEIACGDVHSLCVTQDGSVYSWGAGLMGILGHKQDIDRESPIEIEYFKQNKHDILVRNVRAGGSNSAAIIEDYNQQGQLCIWGEGSNGQIGNDELVPQLTPCRIVIDNNGHIPSIIDLSIGSRHMCCIDEEGIVYSWGNNEYGELGCGLTDNHIIKKPMINQYLCDHDIKATMVVCGERHTSIIAEGGDVYSWGSGETHQIGIFDNVDQFLPIKCDVFSTISSKVVHLSVGQTMSAATTDTGDVYVWGFGMESPIPKPVIGLRSNFVQKTGITSHGLITMTGNTSIVYSWSIDDYDPDCPEASVPQEDKNLRGKRLQSISCGSGHCCAVTSGGNILVWGDNKDHQLGLGSDIEVTYQPVPKEIKSALLFKHVVCGTEHNLAITNKNKIAVWGAGGQGRLGLESNKDCYEPTLIEDFIDKEIIHIFINAENSGCISNEGKLYLWGSNNKGQLGNGTTDPAFAPECCTFFKDMNVISAAYGLAHLVVLVKDENSGKNLIYTCGDNSFGQLADNTDSEYNTKPQLVLFFKAMNINVVEIACGDNIVIARTDNGEVFGWGCGETQQLGPNIMEDARLPVKINFPKDVFISRLCASHISCAALDTYGNLYVWGFQFHDTPTRVEYLYEENVTLEDVALGWTDMLFR